MSLVLELQVGVSFPLRVLKAELRTSERAECTINYRAISLVFHSSILKELKLKTVCDVGTIVSFTV